MVWFTNKGNKVFEYQEWKLRDVNHYKIIIFIIFNNVFIMLLCQLYKMYCVRTWIKIQELRCDVRYLKSRYLTKDKCTTYWASLDEFIDEKSQIQIIQHSLMDIKDCNVVQPFIADLKYPIRQWSCLLYTSTHL